ncbi:MAG TPA: gliding motility lipoprotein GldH [Flavisolibacter sp.]|nr:gliding motility lipoprotein GldH [Flavisolibacter sp.]
MRFTKAVTFILIVIISFTSCTTIDLYEKVVSIPNYEWESTFKPEFRFNIKHTTVPYQVYVVLRHNDKYNWNNLWINLHTRAPGDSIQRIQYELPLASKDRWLGSAMGDIYDHRILLTPKPIYFKRSGEYVYSIEQVMREDPLQHILNVGLRIEKKPQ